jgi:hypothetical protein
MPIWMLIPALLLFAAMSWTLMLEVLDEQL